MNIQKYIPIPIQNKPVYLLLINVNYESGLPETYQLAITSVNGDAIEKLSISCPESIIAHMRIHNTAAILCDAYYVYDVQEFLMRQMTGNEIMIGDDKIIFRANETVANYLKVHVQPIARMHNGDINNTSITFNSRFFLKMYRKVDTLTNPDVELSYYLSQNAKFEHVPEVLGVIELNPAKEAIALGLLQSLVENHGDGESYMRERIANYIERIMARNRELLNPFERKGCLTAPVAFHETPVEIQELVGSRTADQASLIGLRTAEMHLTLASGLGKDFKPEEYSLHYQRSLFSSMQALIRESIQSFERHYYALSEETRKEIKFLGDNRMNLLNEARKIYMKKFDIWKIRTHGSYSLKKLLVSGKDVLIQDFGGKPAKSFSATRLKRSPLRDIAEMVISFHYVAYEGFFSSHQINREEFRGMLPFAEMWAHYISGFFMKAYLEKVDGSQLIPQDKKDLDVVLNTFLMEKSLTHFIDNLETKPDFVVVPLHIIRSILGIKEEPSLVSI